MAASVHHLATHRAAPPPVLRVVPAAPAPRRKYDFAAMVALLALDGADSRTQVDHLRALARDAHLPLPLNPRLRDGAVVTGPASIGRRSKWCALEVDAWLDGRRNPPPAMAALGVVPPAVREDMAHRALQLGARA